MTRAIITPHPDNLGCAESWNLVLRLGVFLRAPYTIVSNSDVWFMPGQLAAAHSFLSAAAAADRALAHADAGQAFRFNFQWGDSGAGAFSLFALTPPVLRRVGLFDENIWPCYYEDAEYQARMKRVGVPMLLVRNASMGHGGLNDSVYSSGVLREGSDLSARPLMEARLARAANPFYIVQKWGYRAMYYDKWGWARFTPRMSSPFDAIAPVPWKRPYNDPSVHPSFWEHLPGRRDYIREVGVRALLPTRGGNLSCARHPPQLLVMGPAAGEAATPAEHWAVRATLATLTGAGAHFYNSTGRSERFVIGGAHAHLHALPVAEHSELTAIGEAARAALQKLAPDTAPRTTQLLLARLSPNFKMLRKPNDPSPR